MRQETFTLSQKELQRVAVISHCVKGDLVCARAAELLDLSPRQVQRLKARYRQGGEAAMAHASRGRPSPRRRPQPLRQGVLHLARTRYLGFNDHHLAEKLQEVEGFSLSRETLRRLLRQAGIGSPRKRRAPAHRQRRLRVAREGEWCSSTAARTIGSKGAVLASPLWACRMMPPVKSSPLNSSLRKQPQAISACCSPCSAASVSLQPS